MAPASILVLGGPGAGKTHYAGQLLGRLRRDRKGDLRLRPGGVDNLNKLEEVLSCLDEGRTAGHTSSETWTRIRFDLERPEGGSAVLEWPEYAGERILSIVDDRIISPDWRSLVEGASGWLLLLRPSTLVRYEHLLERPSGESSQSKGSADGTVGRQDWDDRARYVELLQMMLFIARQSTSRAIGRPRLAVVLSCWDELDGQRTPEKEFAQRMMLLDAFVRSTWEQGAWSLWGLSSLGRELSPDTCDQEYVMQGPEHFGYVIPPGSTKPLTDLTAPIAWLISD